MDKIKLVAKKGTSRMTTEKEKKEMEISEEISSYSFPFLLPFSSTSPNFLIYSDPLG